MPKHDVNTQHNFDTNVLRRKYWTYLKILQDIARLYTALSHSVSECQSDE